MRRCCPTIARLVVELCVIEAVEQVDRAGSRGGHAGPELAGQLGLRGGLEGRELLVACLDQLDPVPELVEGTTLLFVVGFLVRRATR